MSGSARLRPSLAASAAEGLLDLRAIHVQVAGRAGRGEWFVLGVASNKAYISLYASPAEPGAVRRAPAEGEPRARLHPVQAPRRRRSRGARRGDPRRRGERRGSTSITDQRSAPPEVADAARRRSEARAARDWATADALRDEIEAAGWRVVDAGTDLPARAGQSTRRRGRGRDSVWTQRRGAEPARRAGRRASQPSCSSSRRRDPARDPARARRARQTAPAGVDIVVVADGMLDAMRGRDARRGLANAVALPIELVRTSAPLGQAAALNIGIRRARGPDRRRRSTRRSCRPATWSRRSSLRSHDPAVAVAGPFGLVVGRPAPVRGGRRAGECPATPRRSRATSWPSGAPMPLARGPLDEAFRFYRNLDIWWSLVLRDEGEERAAASRRRRARPAADPGRAARLDRHAARRARAPLEAQLLPDPRPLPNPAGPGRPATRLTEVDIRHWDDHWSLERTDRFRPASPPTASRELCGEQMVAGSANRRAQPLA